MLPVFYTIIMLCQKPHGNFNRKEQSYNVLNGINSKNENTENTQANRLYGDKCSL